MLIVMSSLATADQVAHVATVIREMGLTPHSLPGATRTAIGVTGNLSAIDPEGLACLPGVKELLRVTKPYKLASREMHLDDSVVELPMAKVGAKEFAIVAPPVPISGTSTGGFQFSSDFETQDPAVWSIHHTNTSGFNPQGAGGFEWLGYKDNLSLATVSYTHLDVYKRQE